MRILDTKSIYYDDVNLIAQPTVVASRKDIAKELWRILATPMSSIVGKAFAEEALDLGISVCIHRFCTIAERLEMFNSLESPSNHTRLWTAIGLKEENESKQLIEAGARNIILDIANGYMQHTVKYLRDIVLANNVTKIMIGNIHSSSMLPYYKQLSEELERPVYYRCGIAGGSACNTKGMTGVNRGPITEINECVSWTNENNADLYLVADGGIKDPACAAKAFGAGAEMLLIGGYFSKANEAQNVIDGKFTFWGGASSLQQMLLHGKASRHSEGKELPINHDDIKPLKQLVDDLWGGISSAVSYSGHASLTDFIQNGTFELKYN
jgi:GMP reductase